MRVRSTMGIISSNSDCFLSESMSSDDWLGVCCTTDSAGDLGVLMDTGPRIETITITPSWIEKKNVETFTNPKCGWCGTRGPDDYYGNCRSCGGPRL